MDPLHVDGAPAEAAILADPAIAAAAAKLDKGADGESPYVRTDEQTPAPVINWQAEAHELVDLVLGTLTDVSPRLANVWTAERIGRVERRVARVMEKHKADMGRILGSWGAEIALGIALVPAVPPSYVALREDLKEMMSKAADKGRAAPPPGQASAQPPPAVRTNEQGPAAAPDTTRLHELAQPEGTRGPVATDSLQLHKQA